MNACQNESRRISLMCLFLQIQEEIVEVSQITANC